MTNTTNTLNEIAERNSRSRVLDLLFAAMVAMMLVLSVFSLRSAAAQPLNAATTAGDDIGVAHYIHSDEGGACEITVVC